MNRSILGVILLGVALLFGVQIIMERYFDERLELMVQTLAEIRIKSLLGNPWG